MTRYLLLLLFMIISVVVSGQKNDILSESKSSIKFEHALDSSGATLLERFKIGEKLDTNVRIVCTCRHDTARALFLVITHHRTFALDSLSMIKPNSIADIYITKEKSQIARYGARAEAGIVVIILNNKDYPEVYNELKYKLKQMPNFKRKVPSESPKIVIR